MATKKSALTRFASQEVKVFRLTVTPAVAAELLKNARKQRHLSQSAVASHASAMSRGLFDPDVPDPICFDQRGLLANAQHRLTAICVSGETFTLFAVKGLKESTLNLLDGGRKRTTGDRLFGFNSDKKIEGLVRDSVSRAKQTAAIVTTIAGILCPSSALVAEEDKFQITRVFLDEIDTTLDNYMNVKHMRKSAVLTAIVLVYHYIKKNDPQKEQEFTATVQRLSSGEMLSGAEAILYRYLLSLLTAKKGTTTVDTPPTIFVKTLGALQAIVTRSTKKTVRVVPKPKALFQWALGDLNKMALSLSLPVMTKTILPNSL